MNYRIPAVITAKDGSVVAVTDKHKYNEGDPRKTSTLSATAAPTAATLGVSLTPFFGHGR